MQTTAWTSICEDIASLHLAAKSFEEMSPQHQPQLIELMRVSTQRLTEELSKLGDEPSLRTSSPAPQREAAKTKVFARSKRSERPVNPFSATAGATAVAPKPTTEPEPEPKPELQAQAQPEPQTQPASTNQPLDESQKRIRRRRPKRNKPKGNVTVTIMTDNDRCEGIVLNESDTGMGISIAIVDPPPISNGQNVRIIHYRRLRLARVVRTLTDSKGRFEIGVKWL